MINIYNSSSTINCVKYTHNIIVSILSLLIFSVLFPYTTQASCDNPIACEEETTTFSPNSEPKLLADFRDGCYGLDQNDLTPILQNEEDTSVGFFYLVNNPAYVEGSILSRYNLVICDSRKIDDSNFLSFNVLFPQTQESIEKGESYDEYFKKAVQVNIKNSINGNFSVKVTPNFVMLFKSKKLFFTNKATRYTLSNITFSLEDDKAQSVSTTSLVIGLKANGSVPKPTLKNLFLSEKCEALPGNMVCSLTSKIRSSIEEKLEYKFLAFSNRELKDGKIEVTIQDLTNFVDLEKGAVPDGICTDGKLPKYYLDFDPNTFALSQKSDVDMPSGVSCTVKVTILDFPSTLSNISKDTVFATENSEINGVFLADNSIVTADSSVVVEMSVESYTPTEATVAVSKPVQSSASSHGTGGGSHQDTIDRLKNGVGYRTIGEASEAKPDETVLKCPEEKYIRYANQRGFGVSLDLFTDAESTDKAYSALIDLAEQRIVNGDNKTGYARLNSTVSRAEFVKIMTIAREDTLLLGDCLKLSNFNDVDSNDWFTPFVQNLEAKSIVKGYDGNVYKPAQAINLVEAYKVIALSFGYISLEDAEKIAYERGVDWYVPYVEILEKSGVIPSWLKGATKEKKLKRGDVFVVLSNVLLQIDWMKNIDW